MIECLECGNFFLNDPKNPKRKRKFCSKLCSNRNNARTPREMRLCSVDGCDRRHKANGFCALHNARVNRQGIPGEVEPRPCGVPPTTHCLYPGCENKKFAVKGYCVSHYHTILRYGLTVDEYIKILESQNGGCFICGEKEDLVTDHCHEKGNVRGILCDKHNRALGMFEDDIFFLSRAIEYLEKEN